MLEILEEHGVPYYCKVDIEGYDQHCLTGLTDESRPPFFSVEHSGYPFIDHMHELGYDRFKLIHQASFSPPAPRWYRGRAVVPSEKLRAGLERARGVLRGSVNDGRWYFKGGLRAAAVGHTGSLARLSGDHKTAVLGARPVRRGFLRPARLLRPPCDQR